MLTSLPATDFYGLTPKNNLKILLKTYPVALSKNLSCRSIQKTYPVAQSENISC